MAELVEGLEREVGRRGSVGVGIPGAVPPASGLVKNANSTCHCSRTGCIETFLSGPGLARDFHGCTGRQLTAEAAVREAEQGNPSAEACLERYEDRMARALASVINVLDPEVIVLGGGLSNVARLYRNVPRRWGAYVFSDAVATRLVPPRHGDASGARGAAWLWG